MSENMDLVSNESTELYKNENNIINDIQQHQICDLLEKYKFTYDKIKSIFESEVYSTSLQNDLNIIFRKLKKHHNINLLDIVMYLEEFTKIKKVLYFFDADTKWLLKKELSKKYNIKIKGNDLYQIME